MCPQSLKRHRETLGLPVVNLTRVPQYRLTDVIAAIYNHQEQVSPAEAKRLTAQDVERGVLPELLRTDETARRLGCCVRTVELRYIAWRLCPVRLLPNRPLFLLADVDKLINRRPEAGPDQLDLGFE